MLRTQLLRTSMIVGVAAALGGAARADERRSFTLPEHDGYGVGECLAQGPKSTCGRVVADAWCESKGFAKAATFGRGDVSDITGSVGSRTDSPAPSLSAMVTITCDG